LNLFLLGGQIDLKFFEGRVILDKPKGGFIGTDHIGTTTLALAFFTIILFFQGVAASAKGFHDQFPVLQLGEKIIRLLGGLILIFIVMRHNSNLLKIKE
jgi:hypothetical protein